MSRKPRPDARPRMTRRTVLKRAGAVAAVGAAGSAGWLAQSHGRRYEDPQPACELKYLGAREYAIVAALANSLFPPGNSIGFAGTDARVPEYIDRMLDDMRPDKASEFTTMLLLFEHGTTAFGLRARRFTDLPQKSRENYLRRWERARVYSRRMLATALKTVLGIAYFAHPDVQARLGMYRMCGSAADARPREEWS